ncbi:C45 family peptidase [bacterium]|nr:C45 family peptidase [bacterium]
MKKKIGIGMLLIAISITWFLVQGIELICSAPMPVVDQALCVAIRDAEIVEQDGMRRVGKNYAFTRQGVDACHLEGLPEGRGAAMARLYTEEFAAMERSLIETVETFIPYAAVRWLMARLVGIRNRGLDRFVPPAVQAELAGLVLASRDNYPQYGDYFNRLLNYLAAHDISHAYMDYMFMACTAFGLSAEMTAANAPLMARNFDFEAGTAFDEHKLVMVIQPEAGLRFLSIAWPGMVGVVSGLNEAGIGVVLLAGHSSDKAKLGMPVSVVARQVLTKAETLDQAIAVITEEKVFISESFLIGSGQENSFVVVEKTPQRTIVRKMKNGRIKVANHFLSSEYTGDQANRDYQKEGTSIARLSRLTQLLDRLGEKITVSMCVDILRDRLALDDGPLGLGNRSAINPLIASHSMVFDLKNRIAWVSATPHQLGRFVPFALDAFYEKPAVATIVADDLLVSGKYAIYQTYTRELEKAKQALKQKAFQSVLDICERSRSLNPDDYQVYYLSAQALQALDKKSAALSAYQKALALKPAFFGEREDMETEIKALREVTHE